MPYIVIKNKTATGIRALYAQVPTTHPSPQTPVHMCYFYQIQVLHSSALTYAHQKQHRIYLLQTKLNFNIPAH